MLLALAVFGVFSDQAAARPGALKILLVEPTQCNGHSPVSLQSALKAQSGVSSVDIYDATGSTPEAALLDAYDVVLAIGDCPWFDRTAMGDRFADYQDQGGVAVGVTFDWQGTSGNTLAGRWITSSYSPYEGGGSEAFGGVSLGAHNSSSPLLQGINSLRTQYWDTLALTPGASEIAKWSDATSAVAVKGNALGINAYLGDDTGPPRTWSGDFARLIVNAGNVLGRHTLHIHKAGNGSGSITSNPAGINCGAICHALYKNGTLVSLTAAAASGLTFAGWRGAGCSGTSTCTVTMNAAKSVTATFKACVVPKLKGKTRKKAKKALKKANCSLGKVKHAKSTTQGHVRKQEPKPGTLLPVGSKVNIALR